MDIESVPGADCFTPSPQGEDAGSPSKRRGGSSSADEGKTCSTAAEDQSTPVKEGCAIGEIVASQVISFVTPKIADTPEPASSPSQPPAAEEEKTVTLSRRSSPLDRGNQRELEEKEAQPQKPRMSRALGRSPSPFDWWGNFVR